MDVIDRYLRTLRLLLPKDQRDDVIRELSEEMQAQVVEKEAALGRRLTSDEQAAIVSPYGHPLLTAARYRPQRHLIGPVVFPYYWVVLRIALALVATAHLLGAAVLIAGGVSHVPVGQLVENALATALKVAAWVTLLGAVADLSLARSRMLEKWHPMAGELKKPDAAIRAAFASVPGAQRATASPRGRRDASISRVVTAGVLGAWWLAGLRFPVLFFGPGATGLEWGPAMDRLYPVLVIAQVTMLAELVITYFRPENITAFRVTRYVWLTAGVALVYLVATSDAQWMIWRSESAARAGATVLHVAGRDVSLAAFVNFVWSTAFISVAVASAWRFLKSVVSRFRGAPMTAPA